MADRLRLLPAGSGLFLVELADLETTLALLDRLHAAPPEGLLEAIPAARTVIIRLAEDKGEMAELAAYLATLDLSHRAKRKGRSIEIPVRYDGEDLAEAAEHLGWTVEELVRRHTAATYTVAFTGFAPGFAYMTSDDPGFDLPRRKSPRVKIPAGSVAAAGAFSGIYPSDSPGGWQLLGTTPLKMWDTNRPRPALLAPGDRVHFRDIAKGAAVPVSLPEASAAPASTPQKSGLLVIRADRPALFQDRGRVGRADQGVAESGALDQEALSTANRLLGNDPFEPALEITFGGFALRAEAPVTLAVSGAPAPLTIRTAAGHAVAAPFGMAFALDAGDELHLAAPSAGMRSYLALRGGFAVDPVIGSASTDTLAKVGPAAIGAGDRLSPAGRPAMSVDPFPAPPPRLAKTGELITLDIVLGPRTDWFTEAGLQTLLDTEWLVTPESSRVGIRLSGPTPLERRITAELPSEATVMGAIQVPHSGQPVLFLADHPLTGGYPVIGAVARHHLGLAGQAPIGARLRFRPIRPWQELFLDTAAPAETAPGDQTA